MVEAEPYGGLPQRIDKWLFFARILKSRSMAQAMVASGAITLNGDVIGQSSRTVRLGDTVGIALERRDLLLVVRGAGIRRGPSEEAVKLYDDISGTLGDQRRLTPFERAQRTPRR